MANMRPEVIQDERAAGVISGSDPYKELELYLEKVNEELGEVFDRWNLTTSQKPVPYPVTKVFDEINPKPPKPPIREHKSKLLNGNGTQFKENLAYFNNIGEGKNNNNLELGSRSLPNNKTTTKEVPLPPRRRKLSSNTRFYTFAAEKSRAIEREWSESLLSEFNKIIARELTQLQIDAETRNLENKDDDEEDEEEENKEEEEVFEEKIKKCDSPAVSVSSGSSSNSSTGSLKKSRLYERSFSDPPQRPKTFGGLRKRKVILGTTFLENQENKEKLTKSASLPGHTSIRRNSDSELPPTKPKRFSSPEKIKNFFRNTSPFGRKNGDENKKNYDIPPLPKKIKSGTPRQESTSPVFPVALQNFLIKIRPKSNRNESPSPLRDESPGDMTSSGFNTMDSSVGEAEFTTQATQTSPPLSRSSSFTWFSDCSSMNIHTPGSLSEINDDKSSLSSLAQSSPSPQGRSCTNDCGSDCDSPTTTSPPDSPISSRGDDSEFTQKMEESRKRILIKCNRKETWEHIRKRQSHNNRMYLKLSNEPQVWIRRESVETQTMMSRTDLDSEPQDETDLSPCDTSRRSFSLPPLPRSRASPEKTEISARSLPLPSEFEERIVRPNKFPLELIDDSEGSDLPSPSATSLQLDNSSISREITNKSSSAPLLKPRDGRSSSGMEAQKSKSSKQGQGRSVSERHLAEIEAAEACKWLRAAGFPQYAQMYEDLQFPIDVNGVQKDHPFLDQDSLQSLYRRLHALNRCVKMRVDNTSKAIADDSDEDECALSENWTFQPESRRWSRVGEVSLQQQALGHPVLDHSTDDMLDRDELPAIEGFRYGSLPPGALSADSDLIANRFRRTGSERLRDGAKAFLKRMESLKTRRKKKQHREGVVISGPQVLDVLTMQQRMKDLNCVDVSPTGTSGSSPEHMPSSPLQPPPSPISGKLSPGIPNSPVNMNYLTPPFADDSSSYCSDNSQASSTTPQKNKTKVRGKRFGYQGRKDESGCFSDSEVQPTNWKHRYFKDANSNHTKVLEYIDGRSRGSKDLDPQSTSPSTSKPYSRGGSLNLGKESQRYREKLQNSFRKKDVVVYRDKSGSSELTEDSSSTLASHPDSDPDGNEVTLRQKSSVVRWHSFQRGSSRPESLIRNIESTSTTTSCRSVNSLSSGQLLVLRKLALLKLTACMEKYCPTHRTGWNWELPKFIRKIKAPDYKDKTVFGVPLLLSLQRSGQSLPKCIQLALKWLRTNALDQTGIFRKSGVRSRIQTLKTMTENQGESVSYDGQQAYDVADMVKQYFRELPEALLTNKLSETFIAIFQHVPTTMHHDAVQWVLLLLPDEHREALQTILEFLSQVSSRSSCNQMTASNLAVCLAPSLFHLHHTSPGGQNRSASASPRRRKTVGVPDHRELGENRAAHDCLLYLIKDHRNLFNISEDTLAQCHFNYMEDSIPVSLEELGAELQQDWRGYLYACTTALLKEARERSRGWVNVPTSLDQQTEISYKKVGDGHPLRLWKVQTEVEAPPQELLHRVLRERHVWDLSLLKWRIVEKLDSQVEIFQYVCANMPPLPAKDFCILRSWRTDLPKGACVVVETSVEHPDAPVMLGGVRGVVLASRYLIEPCGSGKSRIVHLSRVDTKGRSPDWYNKSYGHICAMQLSRIRTSFKHNAEGPESKV